jgi:CheY-like chemotaxis protein
MNKYALIIDDNQANAEVLEMLLKSEGVGSTIVYLPRNLPAVLDQLESQMDVVFLDLELPNHNGFDLMEMLREHPRVNGAPLVAYTVHTSEINEAREAGFHSFLGKPLDTRRFPDQLHRILNNQPVWEI